MEYQVPQFIEVENKIIGPLTLRQFIYAAGGVGICFIFFAFLPLWIAILLSIPVGAFAAALIFYKVNGKPFIEVLEAGFSYYTGARLFLWKRREVKEKSAAMRAAAEAEKAQRDARREAALPLAGGERLSRGKLKDLAWSLDVKQPVQSKTPAS